MDNAILSVKDLSVSYVSNGEPKDIVKNISFDIKGDSILGLVGGSGCGKSTTSLALLRLLPFGLNIRTGLIQFEGEDLLKCSAQSLRKIRGGKIGIIFQEPLNAFNPVFTIGYQIEEVLVVHTDLNSHQRKKRVLELLELTGIKDVKRVAANYPHQLSGGMRQRAMIAQAIASSPQIVIADEPTSNLDVTLQAKIMKLFQKLKNEFRFSMLLISHDLGMVGHLCDEIAVMNNGQIVELNSKDVIINEPTHSYTKELIEALNY